MSGSAVVILVVTLQVLIWSAVLSVLYYTGEIERLWVLRGRWQELSGKYRELDKALDDIDSTHRRLEERLRKYSDELIQIVYQRRVEQFGIRQLRKHGAEHVNWRSLESAGLHRLDDLLDYIRFDSKDLSHLSGIGATSEKRLKAASDDAVEYLKHGQISWDELEQHRTLFRRLFERAVRSLWSAHLRRQVDGDTSRWRPLKPPSSFGWLNLYLEKRIAECRREWREWGDNEKAKVVSIADELRKTVDRTNEAGLVARKVLEHYSERRLLERMWWFVADEYIPSADDLDRFTERELPQAGGRDSGRSDVDVSQVGDYWLRAESASTEKEFEKRTVRPWLEALGYRYEREMIVEFLEGSELKRRRADFVVKDAGGPLVVIENKRTIETQEKRNDARDQAESYARQIGGMEFVMVAAKNGVWVFAMTLTGRPSLKAHYKPQELAKQPAAPFEALDE